MNDKIFTNVDFGSLDEYIKNDDITDISYSNNGQLWLRSLSKGSYRVDSKEINNQMVEKLAFQCANIVGKVFNMAHPFLDAESAELRMNFIHSSIARNGIAMVIRKTPAKIRLEKEKLLQDKYVTIDIHDFLIKCVEGHCNIIVSGETGAGKTEFVKYLAAHTKENEKLITIEDTLELHLDRIFPHRDIVAMKTNNIASYSDVLVTCMRQNPRWILLSEVRSAEAVTAVRNSISSGHNIISTIHSDKAESIPHRMYSLLETNIDVEQFLKTIYRYIQLGVHIRARQNPETKRMERVIAEVVEFYVTENGEPKSNIIYKKAISGAVVRNRPTEYLLSYLSGQGVDLDPTFVHHSNIRNDFKSTDINNITDYMVADNKTSFSSAFNNNSKGEPVEILDI
jgi:pilus assembly protein CpaF